MKKTDKNSLTQLYTEGVLQSDQLINEAWPLAIPIGGAIGVKGLGWWVASVGAVAALATFEGKTGLIADTVRDIVAKDYPEDYDNYMKDPENVKLDLSATPGFDAATGKAFPIAAVSALGELGVKPEAGQTWEQFIASAPFIANADATQREWFLDAGNWEGMTQQDINRIVDVFRPAPTGVAGGSRTNAPTADAPRLFPPGAGVDWGQSDHPLAKRTKPFNPTGTLPRTDGQTKAPAGSAPRVPPAVSDDTPESISVGDGATGDTTTTGSGEEPVVKDAGEEAAPAPPKEKDRLLPPTDISVGGMGAAQQKAAQEYIKELILKAQQIGQNTGSPSGPAGGPGPGASAIVQAIAAGGTTAAAAYQRVMDLIAQTEKDPSSSDTQPAPSPASSTAPAPAAGPTDIFPVPFADFKWPADWGKDQDLDPSTATTQPATDPSTTSAAPSPTGTQPAPAGSPSKTGQPSSTDAGSPAASPSKTGQPSSTDAGPAQKTESPPASKAEAPSKPTSSTKTTNKTTNKTKPNKRKPDWDIPWALPLLGWLSGDDDKAPVKRKKKKGPRVMIQSHRPGDAAGRPDDTPQFRDYWASRPNY